MPRLSYRPGVRRYVVACVLLATHVAAADEARLVLEVGLRARSTAAPLSLAPDVWVDATPRWTFGLIHSGASVDHLGAGASICLRQDDLECSHVYRGSGLDVLWHRWPMLAPRARLLVRDVDPVKPAVTLGVLAGWTRGRWSITGDPYLRLGLANRDQGNRAALVLPVTFAADVGRTNLAILTGWDSELAVIADGWHYPFGARATVHTTRSLDLAATFGWPALLGPLNDFRNRALFLAVTWHRH
jgi:hypothetical protein